MTYSILSKEEQARAYADGFREGELVRKGYTQRSEYLLNAVSDFAPGSWSDQHTRGYFDGVMNLRNRFVYYKERTAS
jgi:hypothetical protein